MKPHNAAKFVSDARDAARDACEFMGDLTLEQYATQKEKRASVTHMLEIVGEAVRRAIEIDGTIATRISNAAEIIGTRHRIVHAYDRINHEVIWRVVHDDLPILIRELEALLPELPGIESAPE